MIVNLFRSNSKVEQISLWHYSKFKTIIEVILDRQLPMAPLVHLNNYTF